MMEDLQDKIDQYLLGRMSAEQAKTFEEELQQDADKKKAVEETALMMEAFKQEKEEVIRSRLKALQQRTVATKQVATKNTPSAKTKPLPYKRILAAVAALTALAISLWWLLTPISPDMGAVYAAQYARPNIDRASISSLKDIGFANKVYHLELNKAYNLYDKDDIQAALSQFDVYLKAAPKTDRFYQEAKLFKATTLMEAGQFTKAKILLEDITQKNVAFEEATWYLVLCYLKTNEVDKIQEVSQALPLESKYRPLLDKIQSQVPSSTTAN